jgi:hypothetical protein
MMPDGEAHLENAEVSVAAPATSFVAVAVTTRPAGTATGRTIAFAAVKSATPLALVTTSTEASTVSPSPDPDESQALLEKNWSVKLALGLAVLVSVPVMVVLPQLRNEAKTGAA